jgi:uncharacterized protein (DUF1501 family)
MTSPITPDRRQLLGLAAVGALPLVFPRALLAAGADPRRALVVVQLSGGNDGLSTVVPFGDDAYGRARTALRVADPLKLDAHVGLHPGLERWLPLFREGRLAIVQGASYPEPNRSHFKALDIWHTGDARGRALDTGWLGRAIDRECGERPDPNLVVQVGKGATYALAARRHKPVAFENAEAYRWQGRPGDDPDFERCNGDCAEGSDVQRWLHDMGLAARASSAQVRAVVARYRPKAEYPRSRLADDLHAVAALLDGGLGTRVCYVERGGFDTHARQRDAHDQLMREVGGAVAAFQADLAAHGHADRVVTLVFSEFGRRVEENASGGTDHGVAGPMFLLGNAVKGGLHGRHPSLTDLDEGDLRMTTDFRSVYAALLERWLGGSARDVLGREYPVVPVL